MPMHDTAATLADRLEQDRLRHRMGRMQFVVRELRRRADERRADDGAVPAPLGLAIEGFEQELRVLRARLATPSARASARPLRASRRGALTG